MMKKEQNIWKNNYVLIQEILQQNFSHSVCRPINFRVATLFAQFNYATRHRFILLRTRAIRFPIQI